jgi:hypothetical protein
MSGVISRKVFLTTVWTVVIYAENFSKTSDASPLDNDSIILGKEYEVIGKIYAHEVTKNLNARKIDLVTLLPLRLSGQEILSCRLVEVGSRIKVLEKRPPHWFSFLYAQEYIVEVNTIAPVPGAPIVLGLSRGNQGTRTPLNPLIFRVVE